MATLERNQYLKYRFYTVMARNQQNNDHGLDFLLLAQPMNEISTDPASFHRLGISFWKAKMESQRLLSTAKPDSIAYPLSYDNQKLAGDKEQRSDDSIIEELTIDYVGIEESIAIGNNKSVTEGTTTAHFLLTSINIRVYVYDNLTIKPTIVKIKSCNEGTGAELLCPFVNRKGFTKMASRRYSLHNSFNTFITPSKHLQNTFRAFEQCHKVSVSAVNI
ncbi:hypothetical protein BDF20DRAFT_836705 [Mycotypha africana]|uniref:uncharacterized protein n=1 Tax=Mycotypha africana TaxID=64632 RepID=UPI0022FFFA72|nr:uncharacterized protein BDF20DRAFT_836705 [Mycotypha africana]KAI8975289.1 hypothetical protein BDF20DRAFT_836705 [Mycotypha africana]